MDFDPFEALRLKPCSDKAKIKKKYYRLAKELHPDKTGSDDSEFKRINKAYKFLMEMDTNALAEYALNFVAEKGHTKVTRRLIVAAQNGYMKEARRLLRRGADPRKTGTVMVDEGQINKVTPLRVAAFKGHLEMCKLLVAYGIANDINQDNKRMLVCAACYGGHLDIVKHFGTGINYCERLALTAASFHGRDDVVRHLLSEGKASAGQSSANGNSSSSSSSSSWSWRESFHLFAEALREMGNSFANLFKECIRICSRIGVVLSALFCFISGPAWATFHLVAEALREMANSFADLFKECIRICSRIGVVLSATFHLVAEALREMANSFADLFKKFIRICSRISALLSFLFGPAWTFGFFSFPPGLLNRARRVFIGAFLIFAVGSLFIYDLKTIVSTYILLAFIAVFVKFGFDDLDDSG